MSSTSAKRASRASVLISYALAKQALKPLQDGAATQPLVAAGGLEKQKTTRRSATLKEPRAYDEGSSSGAANDEPDVIIEQEQDPGSTARPGAAPDWAAG